MEGATTVVSLGNLNSDFFFKELDVAIVKATNDDVERLPEERHIRKILAATSRAHIAYCMHALARRLMETSNWTVALKTLLVIHRSLQEGDPSFPQELLHFSHVLKLSNLKNEDSDSSWDCCSAWVRTYALFLEERLACIRVLKHDNVGADEQLPALQQLLHRLVGCRPESEGAAASNYVIVRYALALVLEDSVEIQRAVNDGIISLVNSFFEMPRQEAIQALDIYKSAVQAQQAGSLSDFYDTCLELHLARKDFEFPDLRGPPVSFLPTMEAYVRDDDSPPRVVAHELQVPPTLPQS